MKARVQVLQSNTTVAAEASIQAVVIRCGCPPGQMDHPNTPCYRPRATEDQGVIAYTSPNPFKQLAWDIKHAWRTHRGR